MKHSLLALSNGSVHVNKCLNTNIYSSLETTDGQSSKLYLNDVHFFSASAY